MPLSTPAKRTKTEPESPARRIRTAPPAKQTKTTKTEHPVIDVDNYVCKSKQEPGKRWLNNKYFQLTQSDQAILLSVSWLNDRLIDAAQSLLRAQCSYAGLESPLLAQNLQFSPQRRVHSDSP